MWVTRLAFGPVALSVLLMLGGCATSVPMIAAEAEPISVKVIPSAGGALEILTIETTLLTTTQGTWELWYFYDVRDSKSVDPDAHLDIDDYLSMSDATRIQYVPTGNNKWTISLTLKDGRSMDTELFVTVIAGRATKLRGAMGSATLPKSVSE